MAEYKEIKAGKRFMGRLRHGADLLEELTAVCQKHGIKLGRIEGLGAVRKACIAFYDQQAREYQTVTIDRPLEILKLIGNVSLNEGDTFVHAHVTLGDSRGNARGGHLAPGTVVFACEYIIEVLKGPELVRGLDKETGLPLWQPVKAG